MLDASEAGTILIVDDNPRNLGLLSDTLNGAGFEVAVAVDGVRALRLAREGLPDLILLDVRMAGIDGFETCRRLKAEPDTREIPVIFMTASTDLPADRVKGLSIGAVDYLAKPFLDEELLARVRVHTTLRRLTKRLESQVNERLAAEAALQELTRELERRVAERTLELAQALEGLTRAEARLRASNERLEIEVARQTEELRRTNERLQTELTERARAEAARAALQEEIIRAQSARLAELSTPLIPITDHIMVMPLIGTIDAGRAQQALEAALRGVSANRAQVVILDVTGVTVLDSAVASTLMRTATALRLLGARTVITGIRPELAQTLVALGLDFSAVVTRGTLKSGIDHALKQAGDGAASLQCDGARASLALRPPRKDEA
ncbi:response regulator [Sorangium sp. So ce1036]|uniref:response regulator n=1 Tax=Sorangium sp. So ce1036 TaxID=3133328 RepID=UPI003F03F75F